MQTYHGQNSLPATAVISAAVIITGLNLFRQENRRLAKMMFLFTALLLALAFFLNWEKADGIHVYNIIRYSSNPVYLSVFDFAVPMLVSAEYTGKQGKAENLAFAAAVFGFFAVVSVFAFCCVGGNILYSLSPLQMLFQLSATGLIKNYDAKKKPSSYAKEGFCFRLSKLLPDGLWFSVGVEGFEQSPQNYGV